MDGVKWTFRNLICPDAQVQNPYISGKGGACVARPLRNRPGPDPETRKKEIFPSGRSLKSTLPHSFLLTRLLIFASPVLS